MKTLAKTCLISSVILFAVSLTGPGSDFLWGFLKPLSAILFVNFFIMNLLAKEYGKYDEEYDLRLELAGANPSKAAPASAPMTAVRTPQFAR
jgi:hypothetical protein